MPTDAELMRRYVREHDQGAFGEFVRRHMGLVYGAALRRTSGRKDLAEEVAQRVFADAALKAWRLSMHPSLAGWLHQATRFAAIDAWREEARRRRLAQHWVAMNDSEAMPASEPDWERLRPVLDAALDSLTPRDREVVLLRYFNGLSHAEVGARVGVGENAARMRAERALEKLRTHLGKHGVSSTAAALGMVLANQPAVAAPAALSAAIAQSAAATPATGGLVTFLIMNKAIPPVIGAMLAFGTVTLVWTFAAPGVGAEELARLRAENQRLTQAGAQGDADISAEFNRQATTIAAKVREQIAGRNAAAVSRYRDHGQATPRDAFLTYCWALDTGEVAVLKRVIAFNEKGREAIRALHEGMSAEVRAQYPTPEEFIAFLFVADTLLRPIPDVDVAEKFVVTEISPGHFALRRPGSAAGGMEFIQTADGWKCVVPDMYPAFIAGRVLGNEMLGKLGIN